jgi:hypothetical protein
LEEDPFFFRSGYAKEIAAKRLMRQLLKWQQIDRIERICLRLIESPHAARVSSDMPFGASVFEPILPAPIETGPGLKRHEHQTPRPVDDGSNSTGGQVKSRRRRAVAAGARVSRSAYRGGHSLKIAIRSRPRHFQPVLGGCVRASVDPRVWPRTWAEVRVPAPESRASRP